MCVLCTVCVLSSLSHVLFDTCAVHVCSNDHPTLCDSPAQLTRSNTIHQHGSEMPQHGVTGSQQLSERNGVCVCVCVCVHMHR